MTILENFNPEISFWEANPAVNSIPEFSDLKDELGKRKSSTIMWAIAFLLDKNEANVWRNVSEDDLKILVADEFVKDSKFNYNKYEPQIHAYRRHLMTPAQKLLKDWEVKMEERNKFINSTEYDLDTIAKLDRAMESTGKLWDLYEQIKNKLEKETSEGKLRGGAQESAMEQGII